MELRETGRVIGDAGLQWEDYCWGAREIGIGGRGLRSLWRLGLGAETSLACLRAGFHDLGLQRICAETATTNLPAQKLLERSGFRQIGRNADGWPVYAISREDFQRCRPDGPD